MTVEGGGFEAETVTDADGRWRLYVPEKDDYTLEVDETTLPEGVIVEGDNPQEVEFGLTGSEDHQLLPRRRRARDAASSTS